MPRAKAVDFTSTPKVWLTKAEACGYLDIKVTEDFDKYFPNLTKRVPPGDPNSRKFWYKKEEIDRMLDKSTAPRVRIKGMTL